MVMIDWPSSPLIRVTSGSLREVPLHGALAASVGLAAHGTPFKYQIIRGPGSGNLLRRDDPDSGSILAWEDVAPVPVADLENLRAAFRGADISERGKSGALAEVRGRVESDPAVGGFPAMAVLAGDAAAWIYEDRETEEGRRRLANGLTEPVLTIAHYALALLAKSLGGRCVRWTSR